MTVYSVTCDLAPLDAEVEATSEDDAIEQAQRAWTIAAADIIAAGTYDVREVTA